MVAKILSSLKSATTSDFIYSSLSFFASRRGGSLPGRWFVEAIGSLGVEEQAIRQTLFRLERTGVVESARKGKQKFYRASQATEAILSAGRDRVGLPVDKKWDGKWTLVHFRVGEDDRDSRNRLRDVLLVEGFGALGPGLYIHPRDREERVSKAARDLGIADRLNVFRGSRVAGPDSIQLVHQVWDTAAIASRYQRFLKRYEPLAGLPISNFSPRDSFGLRFACMFEFFRITWDDPSLPVELLQPEWPAEDARLIAQTVLRAHTAGALSFADEVLSRVNGVTVKSRGEKTG